MFWRRGRGSFEEDSEQFDHIFNKKREDKGVQQDDKEGVEEHAFFEVEDEELKELDFRLHKLRQIDCQWGVQHQVSRKLYEVFEDCY